MKFYFIIFLFTLFFMPGYSQSFNDSIPPGKNFDKALFRIRLPENNAVVRGVIVLVPGSNFDGRGEVDDPEWIAFADKQQMALLGCYFTDAPHEYMAIEYYAKASEGSGEALLWALNNFSVKSKHPELIHAPLLFWGHSAGGQFNYEFACWKPERVFAFVVNKGGVYYTQLASPATRTVPGIFFTGEKDLEFRTNVVKGIFTLNRRFDARWCYAPEPAAGHELGGTKILSIAFFERCLKTSRSEDVYIPAEKSIHWIGDFHLYEIQPEREWTKKDYPDSWLPDEVFAREWLQFIRGITSK
jgi:hypothetical protein